MEGTTKTFTFVRLAPAFLLSAVLFLNPAPVLSLDNGLALTPPMGWSTWNAFKCDWVAADLLDIAHSLVDSGMFKAGYSTLNIDDCWMELNRSASGVLKPNATKFPEGMKKFSDDLAKTGLGLGIYTAHGPLTCQSYPGSLGHEKQDADMYAGWNVKFVKNDWCWHSEPSIAKHLAAFNALRDAINATGAPMVYGLHWNYQELAGPGCVQGVDCPLPLTANHWRSAQDIHAEWGEVLRMIDSTTASPLASAAGPGQWNDMDMLEVGNGLTDDEGRAHMTVWAIMASPLVAGNDPRSMSAATLATMTNPLVIAVNQDKLGIQASASSNSSATQTFTKLLADGSTAIALLNRDANTTNTATFDTNTLHGTTSYAILDLWAGGKVVGHTSSSSTVISATLKPAAAALYKLVPTASFH